MFCPEYPLEMWLSYRKHLLDHTATQHIESHLSTCTQCLSELLEDNRVFARMSTLPLQPLPPMTLRESFSLCLGQATDAVETLFGRLFPLAEPAVRSTAGAHWCYTSPHFGLTLTVRKENQTFTLTIEGDAPHLSLISEKPIWKGALREKLTLNNLSPGSYTLSVEKGTITFTIEA